MNVSILTYLNDYELISKEVKFVSNSIIRLKLLNALNDGPYSIKEISDNTKLSYCSLSTNINSLELKDWVFRETGKYYLSTIMKLYVDNLLDVNFLIEFSKKYLDFFNNHNVSAIPDKAIWEIRLLEDCEIVISNSTELYKTQKLIENSLNEANHIKAIFPYSYLYFPSLLNDVVEKCIDFEVFLHKNIYKSILKEIKNLNKNFSYNVFNDDAFLLVVSDKIMILGLYFDEGIFDQQRLLISTSKNSIKWGEYLYQKFKEENYLKYSSK